ncbi:MAG: DUF3592 domain-containing protein [Planctomycetota bacterium]
MSFVPYLLGAFSLVGIGILAYGVRSAIRSNAAGSWPTVPGTIEHVALNSSSSDGSTTYNVEVAYTYEVDGERYAGDCLAFGYGGSSARDEHAGLLEALESANGVDVRYDPEDPATSVLSYGMHRGIKFMFAFAATWLTFVGGFAVIYWIVSRGGNVLLDNLSVH